MSSTPGPTYPGKWRGTETSGALSWKQQRSALGHANDDDDDEHELVIRQVDGCIGEWLDGWMGESVYRWIV